MLVELVFFVLLVSLLHEAIHAVAARLRGERVDAVVAGVSKLGVVLGVVIDKPSTPTKLAPLFAVPALLFPLASVSPALYLSAVVYNATGSLLDVLQARAPRAVSVLGVAVIRRGSLADRETAGARTLVALPGWFLRAGWL